MAIPPRPAKFCWTVNTTTLLISEYEANNMLYDTRHPDYRNRHKRVELYEKMADAVSSISGGCICTPDDVRKKINGLRSQFLGEKMKVAKSITNGGSLYVPTVYWYPLLKFLECSTDVEDGETSWENVPELAPITRLEKLKEVVHHEEIISCDEESKTSVTSEHEVQQRRKKPQEKFCYHPGLSQLPASSTRDEVSNFTPHKRKSPDNEDAVDTFTKFIASELRDILAEGNVYVFRQAKKRIQNILMEMWDIIDSSSSASVSSVPNSSSSPTSDLSR